MRTTWFDSISSLLVALLVLVATSVSVLFLLWVLSAESQERKTSVPPARWVAAGSEASADSEFLVPVEDEVVGIEELPVEKSLEQISQSAAQVAALSSSASELDGTHTGQGEDGRTAGPGVDSSLLVPPAQRWQLVFTARDIADYAVQLDQFGIELGVIGGGQSGVDYAYAFSSPGGPERRHLAESAAEKRIYFRYTDASPLIQWDRQLIHRAGIDLGDGRVEMMFVPAELERQLLAIELASANSNGRESLESVQRTVFSLARSGGELVWQVVSQRYRSAK
tara:strand:+ start:1163 stop:2005 length:843 start_codon:yes stop_codon:yes gene_type:complete